MNARKELLHNIPASIKCAYINHGHIRVNLKINYSPDDMECFLRALDFEYDEGYGAQELYGMVWLNDGSWLERREYDGSEAWEHKNCPKIPSELI